MKEENKRQRVEPKTTHFGYQEVPWAEKEKRVKQVFESVAPSYDLMNDLMSFGLHRLWKDYAVAISGVRADDIILDLAGGTGDLADRLLPRLGPLGKIFLADINPAMLQQARNRFLNKGIHESIRYIQVNAECLPFQSDTFNLITMGFGLRNVTDKEAALSSLYQVLKPGGKLLILEFSKPRFSFLNKLYDLYSFTVLPKLGKYIAQDEASYRYLAESIRKHPPQAELSQMIIQAGFDKVHCFDLLGGVVALHVANKF